MIKGITIDISDESAVKKVFAALKGIEGITDVKKWTTGEKESYKPLPRDENGEVLPEFWANGKKYNINPESIGITREAPFLNALLRMDFAREPEDFFKLIEEIKKCLILKQDPDKTADAIILLDTFRGGAKEALSREFEAYYDVATTFINQVGEDHTTYSKELAKEKKEDWAIEGYDPRDIFFCVKRCAIQFYVRLNKLAEETAKEIIADLKAYLQAPSDIASKSETEAQQ